MRYDKDFVDHALQGLKSVRRFSAVVIRLDRSDRGKEAADNAATVTGLLEVVELLDEECRSQKGVWGVLESGLVAGIFPDKNGAQAYETTRRIQSYRQR